MDQLEITRELTTQGFFHIQKSLESDDFHRIARSLGKITNVTAVKLSGAKRVIHQPHAVPFHTDSAFIDYVAWRCVEPDPCDGESLLLDLADINDQFTQSDIDALQNVMSGHHIHATDEEYTPLISKNGHNFSVFYTPWNIRCKNVAAETSFKKFLDYLQKKTGAAISITLKKNEALFIDSRRILHGRKALAVSSPRSLERLWITSATMENGASDAVCN